MAIPQGLPPSTPSPQEQSKKTEGSKEAILPDILPILHRESSSDKTLPLITSRTVVKDSEKSSLLKAVDSLSQILTDNVDLQELTRNMKTLSEMVLGAESHVKKQEIHKKLEAILLQCSDSQLERIEKEIEDPFIRSVLENVEIDKAILDIKKHYPKQDKGYVKNQDAEDRVWVLYRDCLSQGNLEKGIDILHEFPYIVNFQELKNGHEPILFVDADIDPKTFMGMVDKLPSGESTNIFGVKMNWDAIKDQCYLRLLNKPGMYEIEKGDEDSLSLEYQKKPETFENSQLVIDLLKKMTNKQAAKQAILFQIQQKTVFYPERDKLMPLLESYKDVPELKAEIKQEMERLNRMF